MRKLSFFFISFLFTACFCSAQTVALGIQVWSTKNLDVSTFRNGDIIMQAKTNDQWIEAGENKQPAWCYYDNDPANDTKYGKLYNWYAVNDSRGLAPKGWKIPSDDDWTLLTKFLGGINGAGEKMKSSIGWDKGGKGSNESGFSGLPSGCRISNGTFRDFGTRGKWWTSSSISMEAAWGRDLGFNFGWLDRYYDDKKYGRSVRCIKD